MGRAISLGDRGQGGVGTSTRVAREMDDGARGTTVSNQIGHRVCLYSSLPAVVLYVQHSLSLSLSLCVCSV